MDFEPELKAMNDVYNALKNLEDEAKQRVIQWVVGKFSLITPIRDLKEPDQDLDDNGIISEKDLSSFESVADVFADAKVKTQPDKVLVVGAYLQQKKGGGEITGREINKELNQLGHGVKNITIAISSLIKKKPQLMIQTRKEGKSKQAQKKYKVTSEGFSVANKMITAGDASE